MASSIPAPYKSWWRSARRDGPAASRIAWRWSASFRPSWSLSNLSETSRRMSPVPEIAQQLRQFIIDNFLFGQDGDGLSDGDSLLDQGIVDSMGVMELVGFLKPPNGTRIKDQEPARVNLDRIENW